MNKITSLTAAALEAAGPLIQSLDAQEAQALRGLYGALPTGDILSCTPELLLSFVRHGLMVRREAPWGAGIPEDIFHAFVLYPRVHNEPLEAHRALIHAELWPRLAGMTMQDAVLEVNYWCLEKATYRSTDERTASPLTVMRRTFGRCGEESTLLTCALRAVGIPARQVYVPRWAHCDDNHAWVEAWVDGTWHYMGACEPELSLDDGWFTAAATRTMLVHTRGFDLRATDEPILSSQRTYKTINRTGAYAACRKLTVTVVADGAPLDSIRVRFELANMGELFPIHQGATDENGQITLLTGLGCLHLHAHDGHRFTTCTVDVRTQTAVTIDFSAAVPYATGKSEFDLIPPQEAPVQPPVHTAEEQAAHQQRLRDCDAIRSHTAETGPAPQGNGAQMALFLADTRFSDEEKQLALDTLTEKDLADFTAEALADTLASALPYRSRFDAEIWQRGILAPRVEVEPLFPVRESIRAFLAESGGAFPHGKAVWDYLCTHLTMVHDGTAETFAAADSRQVLRYRYADRRGMNLLFVQACRTLGIPARLNPVTYEKEAYNPQTQQYEGIVPCQEGEFAPLTLQTDAGRDLEYGVHFTIGRLEDGVFRTLQLYGSKIVGGSLTLQVPVGHLRVLTCARQIDGTVLVEATPIDVRPGRESAARIALRDGDLYGRLLHAPLGGLLTDEIRSLTKNRYAALLLTEPGQEPTEHLLVEFEALQAQVLQEQVKLLILCREGGLAHPSIAALTAAIPDATVLPWPKALSADALRQAMGIGDRRLPLAVAMNPRGEGLFAFANYNVGSAQSLMDILASERTHCENG